MHIKKERPLVSILIYNYNYGQYLRHCFDSAVNQTYQNTEILFSDNNSNDDSWEIALEYNKKYSGNFFICKNRDNFGTDANLHNIKVNLNGEYFVVLCSDDALEPTFIEKTMKYFLEDPDVGYVMTHRSIIDHEVNKTLEAPFYNKSCKIFPPHQAAVYMMAAINPSISQIIYRNKLIEDRSATKQLVSRLYGTRILDFNIAVEFPIVYLKEALVQHRLHGLNENLKAAGNLMEIIGFYGLNLQFSNYAKINKIPMIFNKFEDATEKVASLSLRYSIRSLIEEDDLQAWKYWHLAQALSKYSKNQDLLKKIEYLLNCEDQNEKKKIIKSFAEKQNLVTRTISYDPPNNFIKIAD